MRLFIALDPSAQEKKKLFDAAKPLRESGMPVNWVPKPSLHLTLKFLGEVRPKRVDSVLEAVSAVAAKAVASDVHIAGFGAFPTIRRPRVLWAGADATPELRSLKHDMEWELAALGFERELRAFQPHITLGRAAGDSEAGNFRDLETVMADIKYRGTLQVRRVDVMSSTLTPEGPRYETVASATIGAQVESKKKKAG